MNHDYSMLLSEQFGMLLPEEVILLKRTIRNVTKDSPVIIDIGTGTGITTIASLEEKPLVRITSIDHVLSAALGRVVEAGLPVDRVEFLTCDSTEASDVWEGDIDVVILDGDHTPSKVDLDLRAWCKALVIGGVLIVHDYGAEIPMWADKKAVVDRYARYNGLQFVERAGCLAVFTKGGRGRK